MIGIRCHPHQKVDGPGADVLEERYPLLEVLEYSDEHADAGLECVLFKPACVSYSSKTVLQVIQFH